MELMEFDIERSPEHDLTSEALWERIFTLLKEGDWVVVVSPPCNTFSRARFQRQHLGPKPLRTHVWPRGFPWLSNRDKEKVDEANFFVDRCLEACDIAASHGGHFLLEHPEDLGAVQGVRPGSIWQWDEVLELIPKFSATCFAVHQCSFGALTPKPTRFLCNFKVDDSRCRCSLPKFDKFGFYKGPLPKFCGHTHDHKLIGKSSGVWNTAPSASYPPLLCEFLSKLILHARASCGRGPEDETCKTDSKRRRLELNERTVSNVDSNVNGACSSGVANSIGLAVQRDGSESGAQLVQLVHSDAESAAGGAVEQHGEQQFDMEACGNLGGLLVLNGITFREVLQMVLVCVALADGGQVKGVRTDLLRWSSWPRTRLGFWLRQWWSPSRI